MSAGGQTVGRVEVGKKGRTFASATLLPPLVSAVFNALRRQLCFKKAPRVFLHYHKVAARQEQHSPPPPPKNHSLLSHSQS